MYIMWGILFILGMDVSVIEECGIILCVFEQLFFCIQQVYWQCKYYVFVMFSLYNVCNGVC